MIWYSMNEKILPTILIVIDILSSIPYWHQGNWRMGVYWLCAAGLTFVVTY